MRNIRNILKTNEWLIIIIIASLISIILLLIPDLDNSYIKVGKIYISEIMAKNTYTIMDDDFEYSDYIELYNDSKRSFDLSGYHLSDSEFETSKWTFPKITLLPKEYLIIFASGKDKCDLEKRICHTNFKLSSKGEIITLTDRKKNIINKVNYPALSNDLTYGYYNRKYCLLNEPTPKEKNSHKFKYQRLDDKDLYINEYMTHNKRSGYDVSGNYNDFLEIYNNRDKPLDLSNLYLSDSLDDLQKYKLPNITINGHDYLLVYLSSNSDGGYLDGIVTTNFGLNDSDMIVLSNGKNVLDKVSITKLPDNVSYGRKDSKWYYFTKPTPGRENDTMAFTTLGGKT